MRNTICPWLNVHYLGMNVRVYRFMFILHYICQDSICRIKREYTRSPSQKKKQGKFFSIQWRKMKNWNCCTQRLMCIHTIVLNIRIQIIYNWMRFFITSTASFFWNIFNFVYSRTHTFQNEYYHTSLVWISRYRNIWTR